VRKAWTLGIASRTCRLEVDWDLTFTSRGSAKVDGVVVRAWWTGVKLPGAAETFAIDGHAVVVRQSWFGFDLDLRGAPDVRVIDGPAPYAGSGRNLSRAQAIAWGVGIALGVVALLAGLVAAGVVLAR
jgi:hypothetical protein